MAKAFGETAAGKMAIFTNNLNQLKESLGIAILPAMMIRLNVSSNFASFFGGTSLLIVVGVGLDTLQQIRFNQQAASLSLQTTTARLQQGMASQLEMEEARRQHANSQLEQLQARLERNRAWLGLYRAVGGGWSTTNTTNTTNTTKNKIY